MNRSLIVGAALAAMLGFAGLAQAQGNPAPPPPASAIGSGPLMTHGPYPMASPDLVGTARRDKAATPSCGAANPQGGTPTPVTWGDCP
jgi:hypothetical protein